MPPWPGWRVAMVEERKRRLAQARHGIFEIYHQERGIVWVEAQGNSMRPLIEPGIWLRVDFGPTPPNVGEIIVFHRGDRMIAHRLVAWRPDHGRLIAKGDAEAYCDAP